MSDGPFLEDDLEELWPPEDDYGQEISPWRRRIIIGVAVVAAIAVGIGPLYNILDRGQPPIADNGLEICGFDYCVVQDAARTAGLGATMTKLANRFVDDQEAQLIVDSLVSYLNMEPVELEVVDVLEGRLAGQYSPDGRKITVERPITVWIIAHEVAHADTAGHGIEFQETLFDIARWLDQADQS